MDRYIRQTILKEVGQQGQQRLESSKVIIVGCGGLGSVAAPYLAAAGVGQLVLVDGDRVERSNLHRQVFYTDEQTGQNKAQILGQHLSQLNPEIQIKVVDQMLKKDNILNLIQEADLVLECTDSILCKYLVNDYCHHLKIPMVYGAIHQFTGQVSVFENTSDQSIHLRDFFAEPNQEIPNCSEVGVLGTVAGTIGLMQANEALKFLMKMGKTIQGQLLQYDFLHNEQFFVRLKKTYSEDIATVIANTSYEAIRCEVPEINFQELMANRSNYDLISILGEEEHQDIDANVIHIPLHNIDPQTWKNQNPNRIPVFYCKSGKRSIYLVSEINRYQASLQVLSLAGGMNGVER